MLVRFRETLQQYTRGRKPPGRTRTFCWPTGKTMKRGKALTQCGEVFRNSMPINGGHTPGRMKKACWPVGGGR
jgi:hypothetical protein